jgi:hypothetical protein
MGWRKQKAWTEIRDDPRTPYMVGRLLGANEMAVQLLRAEENDTARHVAEVLDRVLAYFLADDAQALVKPEARG